MTWGLPAGIKGILGKHKQGAKMSVHFRADLSGLLHPESADAAVEVVEEYEVKVPVKGPSGAGKDATANETDAASEPDQVLGSLAPCSPFLACHVPCLCSAWCPRLACGPGHACSSATCCQQPGAWKSCRRIRHHDSIQLLPLQGRPSMSGQAQAAA